MREPRVIVRIVNKHRVYKINEMFVVMRARRGNETEVFRAETEDACYDYLRSIHEMN